MSDGPFSPLINLPWVRWIDRTEIPATAVGLGVMLVAIPFYSFRAHTPEIALGGSAFPPALAIALTFLLLLTRGASRDLSQLVFAGKIKTATLESLAASRRSGLIELGIGLAIGLERVYAQVTFANPTFDFEAMIRPGALFVCVTIVCYTVIQIHLLVFCVRQVIVFRRVAQSFQVDLLSPELNNALSNPLIRFIALGFVGVSLGLLLFQVIPYSSLQVRLLEGGLFAMGVWILLICVSFIPLLILKSRIAVAKSMEISTVRRALQGDYSGSEHSQFGERLANFTPADLMYYEDRIKAIWEWPFEAHVRRLVIFGLLPPLTWVLAALIEIVFETMLTG